MIFMLFLGGPLELIVLARDIVLSMQYLCTKLAFLMQSCLSKLIPNNFRYWPHLPIEITNDPRPLHEALQVVTSHEYAIKWDSSIMYSCLDFKTFSSLAHALHHCM